MASHAIEEVTIDYHGEVTSYGVQTDHEFGLKGLLSPHLGETVNFVNAGDCQKRGIRVIESIHTQAEDFASLMSITVRSQRGSEQHCRDPFGERIENRSTERFLIEAIPEGDILLIDN
jgi:D-3-phosphoglycerate dehydrogenase